jgi:hypothetical protein
MILDVTPYNVVGIFQRFHPADSNIHIHCRDSLIYEQNSGMNVAENPNCT